jgi:hypothetical protein
MNPIFIQLSFLRKGDRFMRCVSVCLPFHNLNQLISFHKMLDDDSYMHTLQTEKNFEATGDKLSVI